MVRFSELCHPKSIGHQLVNSAATARGLTSPARPFSFVLFVVILPLVLAHNSRLKRQAGGILPYCPLLKVTYSPSTVNTETSPLSGG